MFFELPHQQKLLQNPIQFGKNEQASGELPHERGGVLVGN